jgi:co-chaperonin GroES (HSP10)
MEPKLTPKEERYKKAYAALQKAFVTVKGIQNIKTEFVPFNNTVLVKKLVSTNENQTESGIILPDGSYEKSIKPNIGVIVASGPECNDLVIPGIKIAYSQFANLEVFVRGEFYHVIHDHDIHFALTDRVYAVMDGKTDKEARSEKGSKRDNLARKVFKAREEEFKNKIELNIKKG